MNRVHFCKAECLRQAVTGTFAIPRKTKLTGDKNHVWVLYCRGTADLY
ncbi:hypothetical protein MYD03_00150 [Mediterraneibacter gnavus]